MSLRFIIGRAGSGKTYYCLSEMARLLNNKHAAPLLFILPEQATFIHERMLACDFMPHGYMGGEVTSFDRLAWQAMRQRGKSLKPKLSEAARVMLMGSLIQQCRSRLKLFGATSFGHGLADSLVALAEEMLAYNISPACLAEAAQKEIGPLQDKLHDIALLYGEYAKVIEDYDNSSSSLAYLARSIAEEGFLANATVFVDGYSHFTSKELKVLAALMQSASRLEIALAIDPEEMEHTTLGQDIFTNCRQSYQNLLKIAEQLPTKTHSPLLLYGEKGRFAKNPELNLIEKFLFTQSNILPQQEKPCCLQVMAAANPREEVMIAAAKIKSFVRCNGLRYKEIGVITRDLHTYEDLLPEIFSEFDIPYFSDTKKTLLYHPLIELFRAVLEIWAGEAHYRQIFRYFKSGLTPLTLSEIDKLENYCLAHGIRHWQWQMEADWQYWRGAENEEEAQLLLAEINELRKRGVAALKHFLHKAPAATAEVKPGAFFTAFRELLEELNIEDVLETWQYSALAHDRAEEAELHRQALNKLNSFLSEAEALLSASCLAARQLVQLLDAGCAALTLSLIPPGLDQVLVASVERSRNPELRLVIVLGVNADTLPGCAVPTALLSDHERIKLSHSGIELAPGTVSRQMAEHFLAYIALTRSHEYLLLTYAQSNAQNKALQPSPLIKKLQKIFANLKIERFGEPHTAEELTGNTHTVNLLARHLKNERLGFTMPVFWQEIYNWYAAQESWQPQLKRIEQGLSFRPYAGRLSVENQKSLYGKTIVSSVSRLEKFNACPFAYFAAYILKLGPRPQYEFTALERGEIFHRALAHLSSLLAHNKPGWRELTQQQAAEVVEQVLAELLPNLLSGIMQSTARYRYQASRLQDTLSATLMIIADHIKHGYFVPVAWELPFGNNSASALPPLTIELSLGRKLEITGQIDRVDIAKPANGAAYVRIVDYKSAKRTLTKSDIENGLALQLPVYLETVLAHPQYFHEADLQPAGLYYMAVRDDYTAVSMPPAGQENSASTMRLSGITIKDAHAVRLADPQINGHSKFIPAALSSKGFYASSPGISEEEFREMRLQLTDILCKTAENMAGGLATIEPRRYNGFDACAYCDYRTFCGIDGETMRSLSASIE